MLFYLSSSETLKHLGNINTLLASNEDTALAPVLPIVIFIYAIKNILYPNFLIELIPDFLDLLTMVEFYRIRVTEEASNALAWNDFYKNAKDARTLEVEDEDFLSHLQETQDDMRKIFMQIVAECCFIVSLPMLFFYFASYFISRIYIGYGSLRVIPISGFGGIDISTPKDKTPKNLQAFITSCRMPTRISCVFQQRVVLTRCIRHLFVLRTLDPQGKCPMSRLYLKRTLTLLNLSQSIQDVFNSRSFQDQSLIFYDKERLLNLINFHLNYVHEGVQKLQVLFPEKA